MKININNVLDKVLDKIKEIIGFVESDDTKILIDIYDELPDDITLNYVVTLLTCVTKDGGKFYPQLLLRKALFLT